MSKRKPRVIPVDLDEEKSHRQMVDDVVQAILTCEVDGRTVGNGTDYIYWTPDEHWLCDEHYEEWCKLQDAALRPHR